MTLRDDSTILVCGSRNWTNTDRIEHVLKRLWVYPDLTLLHGDAPGVDRIAAGIGRSYGWRVRAFPAEWEQHGKAAGPIRNRQMLDENPDLVIAFPLGESRGTMDTVREAERRGIRTVVVSA